jgi:choline dehydrogenase
MNDNMTEEKTFDYVIVGAGPSAMGLLYGLLSPYSDESDPPFTIAVIERGTGPPHDSLTSDPRRWYEAAYAQNSKSVMHYPTEITGRQTELIVGQGLGGTSNVNACLCLPPLPQDFDSWPMPWKVSISLAVKKVQEQLDQNGCLHYGLDPSDVVSPFSKAVDISTRIPSLVSKDSGGRFVRNNFYKALLEPFLLKHPHLQTSISWFRGVEAQRLLRDGQRIMGVECCKSSEALMNIRAREEVILCAGAIESPVLLLASGVGETVAGIGKHLKDQIILPRIYLTKWRPSPNLSSNSIAALGHVKVGTSIFQVAVLDAACNISIMPSCLALSFRRQCRGQFWNAFFDYVFRVVRWIFQLVLQWTPLNYCLQHFAIATLLCLLHPTSEGTVRIVDSKTVAGKISRRRDVQVHVDAGYLRNYQDVESYKQAWEVCGRMKAGVGLDLFSGPLFTLLDYCGCNWFPEFCKGASQQYSHYCGTCSLQVEHRHDWVVDLDLKVRMHEGLRVCDASIFPTMVSVPPSLTCAALGQAFAQTLVFKRSNHQ